MVYVSAQKHLVCTLGRVVKPTDRGPVKMTMPGVPGYRDKKARARRADQPERAAGELVFFPGQFLDRDVTAAAGAVFERFAKFCNFTADDVQNLLLLPRREAIEFLIACLLQEAERVDGFIQPRLNDALASCHNLFQIAM